jgi:hypothetical protein
MPDGNGKKTRYHRGTRSITFPGWGLFEYDVDGNTWNWLSNCNAVENMIGISGNVYAHAAALVLWKYDGGWAGISPINPNKIKAYEGNMVANFPGYGLVEYDGHNWISWLTPNDTVIIH